MAANLTPQYHDAEAKYREAKTPEDKMAALDQKNQDAIRKLAGEYQSKWLDLAMGIEAKSLQDIKDGGIVVNEPSEADRDALLELAQPLWADWAAARGGDTPELLKKVRDALGR